MIDYAENGLPRFFNEVPTITMFDPLAQLLGGAKAGLFTYCYEDAVKLAGHSCPTVAGAYLMLLRGLAALYPEGHPRRGGIEVQMSNGRDVGTTGVIASIVTLITGAATELGFAGLGGRIERRRDLLSFAGHFEGVFSLKRRDNGQQVRVSYNPDFVPFAPEMSALLPKVIGEEASAAELEQFGQLWQQRVQAILTEQRDDPRLVTVQRL